MDINSVKFHFTLIQRFHTSTNMLSCSTTILQAKHKANTLQLYANMHSL